MTAPRAAVRDLIKNDSVITDLGVQKVYASNSIDTPSEDLFIVIRWEGKQQFFKDKGTDRCTVWVHDKNQDYSRIDKVLLRVKPLLLEASHVEGSDGFTMTLAEWNGDGPDLVDGGFHTNTRYSDFTVASRYTTP